MAHLQWENTYAGLVIGVDEVGRGPLAGPVIACACVLPDKQLPESLMGMITDSKKLSHNKRRILYPLLQAHTLYAFGESSVAEIDEINILNATMRAMCRAVDKVIAKGIAKGIFSGIFSGDSMPEHVLIDGNKIPMDMPLPATAIIKGDSISLSIASASILAKVYRDSLMQQYAEQYPLYDWHKNAGYGTKAHLDAIKQYGITPHHRTSFAPVRDFLATDSFF